jgi:sugar porter (SP) family MFS transporter
MTGRAQARLTPLVIVVAALAALGGMLFGFDTGVISGAILFITNEFGLQPVAEEVTTSAVLVGAMLGAVLGGFTADRFGRRRTIAGAAMLFIVGTLACATSPSIQVLWMGRIVIGIGVGAASFAAPLYNAEIAPSSARGAMVSLSQLAVTGGILWAYVVDYLLSSSADWRGMFAAALIPAITLFVGMLIVPDSPRWLMQKGRVAEATETLCRLRHQQDVQPEIQEVQECIAGSAGGSWCDLWSATLRTPMLIGIGLAAFQQLTGINTVIYYAPTIFQFAGLPTASVSIAATLGVGVVNLIMTAIAVVLVDRLGRRPLLLTSLAGMVAALVILSVGFSRASLGPGNLLGLSTGLALMLYVAAFAIGLGPIFWLLIAEIFPLTLRSRAMSIATLANWFANFVVAVSFLSFVGWLGQAGTFLLYALVGLAAWLFVFRTVPETKGKSLEEVEQLMAPTNRAACY